MHKRRSEIETYARRPPGITYTYVSILAVRIALMQCSERIIDVLYSASTTVALLAAVPMKHIKLCHGDKVQRPATCHVDLWSRRPPSCALSHLKLHTDSTQQPHHRHRWITIAL